jgi:hypothetical protein
MDLLFCLGTHVGKRTMWWYTDAVEEFLVFEIQLFYWYSDANISYIILAANNRLVKNDYWNTFIHMNAWCDVQKFQLLACRTFGDPLAKEPSFGVTLLLCYYLFLSCPEQTHNT